MRPSLALHLIALALILSFTAVDLKSYATGTVPTLDHVVIVILENHGYTQIIGSASAPHINALANDSSTALFTYSYAIEHPSQPNYLDFYSGCNQGVTNDNVPASNPFTTANLGRQLLDAGKTFITYSEDLPSVGYNGATSGNYARKHNPAANWMGTGTNQIATTTNQPWTAFPSDFTLLPTVCYVVPNQNNDMHNGTIATGDTWFYNNLNSYIQWARLNNSLLILTFDEDNNLQGNHICTIFTGQMVKRGQYSETINHYSVLRTIEDMYSLPYACNASTATSITDVWVSPLAINPIESISKTSFTIYPNPFSDETIIRYRLSENQNTTLEMYDLTGKKVYTFPIQRDEQSSGIYEYRFSPKQENIQAGAYFVKLSSFNESLVERILLLK